MCFRESKVCTSCLSFLSTCLALASSSGPTMALTYLVLLLIVVCGDMSSTVNFRSICMVRVGVLMVSLLLTGVFVVVLLPSDVHLVFFSVFAKRVFVRSAAFSSGVRASFLT